MHENLLPKFPEILRIRYEFQFSDYDSIHDLCVVCAKIDACLHNSNSAHFDSIFPISNSAASISSNSVCTISVFSYSAILNSKIVNSACPVSACANSDKSNSIVTFSDYVLSASTNFDPIFPVFNSAVFYSISSVHSVISAHHATSANFVSIGYNDVVVQ